MIADKKLISSKENINTTEETGSIWKQLDNLFAILALQLGAKISSGSRIPVQRHESWNVSQDATFSTPPNSCCQLKGPDGLLKT